MKIRHNTDMSIALAVEVSPRSAQPAERNRIFPTPAVILFDLDGTLVDTMGQFADLATEVMVRWYGLARRNARRLYLQTSGVPFHQQLEVVFGEHEHNSSASTEYERRKHEIASHAEMDGDTARALWGLRARGSALVVSSHGMQEHVDAFATRSQGLFDLALGYDTARAPVRCKGEPHVAEVCAKLRVRRDELTFVGDSLRDGELAASSGVRFIGRAGTFSESELAGKFPTSPIVGSVAEIPALV